MWRCRGMGIGSSGGGLRVYGRGGGTEASELWRCAAGVWTLIYWRSGALEACCTCSDVEEARRHRGSELWRCAAAVEKLEIWSSGGTLQALPLCLKSSSVLFVVVGFLAFVPVLAPF